VIAAKAVAFGEALHPSFAGYAKQVVANAHALASVLIEGGLDIVSDGTDSHIVLVDLRPKGLTGKAAEISLEHAGLTCNKNGIPFDPEKPAITSGIRLGTPAGTTRGFGEAEFTQIGNLIVQVLDGLAANGAHANGVAEAAVRREVARLCRAFPIYSELMA
jgi:glycine hydroxymethyltransferase